MTRSDLDGLPLIVKSLEDPDPKVRIAAIEALQLMGTAEELPEIKKRLGDPSPLVRFVATIAVEVLSWEENDRPTQPPKPRGPWDLN
jgi:HEAT repeat protein